MTSTTTSTQTGLEDLFESDTCSLNTHDGPFCIRPALKCVLILSLIKGQKVPFRYRKNGGGAAVVISSFPATKKKLGQESAASDV